MRLKYFVYDIIFIILANVTLSGQLANFINWLINFAETQFVVLSAEYRVVLLNIMLTVFIIIISTALVNSDKKCTIADNGDVIVKEP